MTGDHANVNDDANIYKITSHFNQLLVVIVTDIYLFSNKSRKGMKINNSNSRSSRQWQSSVS